jgi:hypothetical protein
MRFRHLAIALPLTLLALIGGCAAEEPAESALTWEASTTLKREATPSGSAWSRTLAITAVGVARDDGILLRFSTPVVTALKLHPKPNANGAILAAAWVTIRATLNGSPFEATKPLLDDEGAFLVKLAGSAGNLTTLMVYVTSADTESPPPEIEEVRLSIGNMGSLERLEQAWVAEHGVTGGRSADARRASR